jgi:hypothetical protein
LVARDGGGGRGGGRHQPLALLLLGELLDRQVPSTLEREGVRRVHQGLDLLEADPRAVDVAAYPVCVRLEGPDRELGTRALEGEVVLEEVVVAVDVRDGENLQAEGVVAHQIGEGGVRVDDHLVGDTRYPVVVERLQLLVGLAVGPVRIVGRHARVGHVAEHLGVVAELELLREAVEPELGHLLPDACVPVLEVLEGVGGHRRGYPCSRPRSLARKALKEGQMSSFRSISTVWKFSASRRRKMFSIELS